MYYVLYWNGDRFEVVREDFASHDDAAAYSSKIEGCESFVVKREII